MVTIISVPPCERFGINHIPVTPDVTDCKVTIVYKGFAGSLFMVNIGDAGGREDRGCRTDGLLPLPSARPVLP